MYIIAYIVNSGYTALTNSNKFVCENNANVYMAAVKYICSEIVDDSKLFIYNNEQVLLFSATDNLSQIIQREVLIKAV